MKHILRQMLALALLCIVVTCASASAPDIAGIRGKVADPSGAAISRAVVSLTDLTTNTELHTTTDAKGQFSFNHVPLDPQLITVAKEGFESFTQRLSLSKQVTRLDLSATLKVASMAENVEVRGTVDPEARPVPTRDDVMMTPDTERVLDRQQLDEGGPLAGGAQMIQSTPGANVVGYGETGATKYTIILNGIQQGWGGEATSFTGPGSLGITFDGIPVADPATGLWQSATLPQNLVMQNLVTTYGPGLAADRGYTDVGGRVEFTPIQPTVDRHLALAITDGPWGQQNFAFVGNTGRFRGWSTVLGGGVGRGDDYRPAPDGFNDPAVNGSAFGKTLKSFSSGSIAIGMMYSKAGGYRPQVIPTTNVGLSEGSSGVDYSQPSSGFYSSLPFADYNKYDTNEMFLGYGRERFTLTSSTTLDNSTWYNHIRRFHRRNTDALSAGAQVDEWNNPHSDIFGDEVGLSQVFPMNTFKIGSYYIHEIYNTHNIFYNPSDGGSGSQQIVGAGSKFRSGYFNQDNVVFYAQDDFHPIPRIHIIPSVRVDGFRTGYSDEAARDFTFSSKLDYAVNAQGNTIATTYPVYQTHCALNPKGSDPYSNIFGTPVATPDGSLATDQGSLCSAHESRSAVEPGIDASYTPKDWLTLYGGYDTIYRSPAFGGGGGLFQAVNPHYYILAEGKYAQFGGKVHFTNAPVLKDFIAGANYFHLDYVNQEIDVETATGIEETSGGNSSYHGMDLFLDADPQSNLHFMLNMAAEASNFTTYVTGGPISECGSSSNAAGLALGCAYYNNLPVSYVPKVTLNAGVYYGIQHNGHVLVEPRFWINYSGTQDLWSNCGTLTGGVCANNGQPTTQTMPSYTTANLAFNAPIKFRRFQNQSLNLEVDMMNITNSQYNEWEYISSGGYFAALAPNPNNAPGGYINAYPGAPRTIYGTISYQF